MFTGIIEEIGKIYSIKKAHISGSITIEAKKALQDTVIGDSIAVNGVCLTVCKISDSSFTADVLTETMRRSNLCMLKAGDAVNLERAAQIGGRLGGHFVLGHVDSTGKIISKRHEENSIYVTIEADAKTMKYIVEKGSAAIDGISLTIASATANNFTVCIIPHTSAASALIPKRIGSMINIETDIIGKYVEKLLAHGNNIENRKGNENSLYEMLKRF